MGGFVVWRALPPAPDAELDGLRVVTNTERDNGFGFDAVVGGELRPVGSCIGVGDADHASLVVWPRGTKVEDGAIVTPGGIRVRMGEELRGGGGYTDDPTDFGAAIDPDIPDDCRAASSGEIAVLNGDN
ncbi:hypothetical protein GCM10027215_34670 [Nocardioides zeae]